MRYMMLMIPRVFAGDVAPNFVPPADLVARMMKYNKELTSAGALLSLDGLHPPAKGVRVRFPGGKPKVTDGPFTEAKEVLGGYWIIQLPSVRADLLAKVGRLDEARAEFERAAALTKNRRERTMLLGRAEACVRLGAPP